MEFLVDFQCWIDELCKECFNFIIVGDYNIVNYLIDIYDFVCNKKFLGFFFEECEWLSEWFFNGFIDVFCYLYFEEVEYSWWSYCVNV